MSITKYQVQIIFLNKEKIIHGKYKTLEEAKKFVKWYKTGDLEQVKQIKII